MNILEKEDLKIEDFKQNLLEKKIPEEQIQKYIDAIHGFHNHLKKSNETIFSFQNGKLIDYTDKLVEKDKQTTRFLIIGLWSYFPFIKRNNYMEELIDIAESWSAMVTLYARVAEWHGEKIRDEVFEGIVIPPLGAHPNKKPAITKVVMKRLEEKIGVEKTKDLLRPCLHGREPLEKAKEEFQLMKDLDAFLEKKQQDAIKETEGHRDNGTAMFAQLVDDEVVEYVKNDPFIASGKRLGNKIIASKRPYQIKHFLNTDDNNLKRFFICYCPWVRGAMKEGEDKELSRNFCYCSGGFYKLYWDELFGEPVKVEPIETALWGDMVCKFEIEIPEKIMKEYIKK